MNFRAYLENLRGKPEHIRKRYAFWTSFGVTALIAVIWVASFSTFGFTGGAVANNDVKISSPGSSMIAGVGGFFKDVKELIFGARKVTYSTVEVLPGKK